MRLRFRQVDRVRLACHQADQAFVGSEHGVVHGLGFQAFGGIELEPAVHAQHIDGADLRHHVGGDQHHDLVEAFLRADRLRHHFAEPSQQHARTAERATHGVILGARPERKAPARLNQEIVSAGPVTRGHIHSWPIANAPCKPQAKGRRDCRACHHMGVIFRSPWMATGTFAMGVIVGSVSRACDCGPCGMRSHAGSDPPDRRGPHAQEGCASSESRS